MLNSEHQGLDKSSVTNRKLTIFFSFHFCLAFADVTSQTEIKIIYDNTTVLTEQKEGTYMSYYNRVFDSAVNIYFGLGYNLTIADRRFDNVKEAGYRFVVEKVRLPSGSEFDCLENTSASLRPLISCQGSVRARELTNVEQKQIEEFKNNREGKFDMRYYNLGFSGFLGILSQA